MERVVRVPAVSVNMADIPPDEHSWRKYGEKSVKGSPHPRGYYKCSSVRGCGARKHVEKALDDPSVFVVTYRGDHSHPQGVTDATVAAALVHESDINTRPSLSNISRMGRVVGVPATSVNMSDIPPDDHSWRKYGEKSIQGSSRLRGYYKCSSVRGCPARKHVEKALDDPSVLVVTYEGNHSHPQGVTVPAALVL